MIKISLNGNWDFIADLDPKYHGYKLHYPVHPYSQADLNRRHWLKIQVPGVWQKYAERYDIFEGVCWYAREFELEAPVPGNARLRFGGVNYFCEVYINDKYLGSHEGGYTEFVLNASGKLKSGKNHIAVMVDNRATKIKWPPCLGYFKCHLRHRKRMQYQ